MGTVDIFYAYLGAFNRGDTHALAALYAERTEFLNPFSAEPLASRAAVEAFVVPMFGAFADMGAHAESVIVDGSALAARLTIVARHVGDLPRPTGPAIATGRTVRLRTAEFIQVDTHGLIIRHERIFDSVGLLRQLEPGR